GTALASAETYNFLTNSWAPVAPMGVARYVHTATLLPDGRVLAVGGVNDNDYLASAETFSAGQSTALVITSANGATFPVGSAGTCMVRTMGAPTAVAVSGAGTRPSGVRFTNNENGTATLRGTPGIATGGSYLLTITASNGVAPNATQAFTLTVNQVPAITST